MSTTTERRLFYWERQSNQGIIRKGGELAALRRGINAAPGTTPSMWPFYVTSDEGPRLDAEHYALALFAIHQQSKDRLVHKPGVSLGASIRQLHARYSEDAVDRRFFAAVTAPELGEVVQHLRGLIQQLRSISASAPFDYTRLVWDLSVWHVPEKRQGVQRRWGLRYHAGDRGAHEMTTDQPREGDQ